MILRTLLSQLTKKVEESQSRGDGSSESQLTDIGIPSHAWNYWLWIRLTRYITMYKYHIHDSKQFIQPSYVNCYTIILAIQSYIVAKKAKNH